MRNDASINGLQLESANQQPAPHKLMNTRPMIIIYQLQQALQFLSVIAHQFTVSAVEWTAESAGNNIVIVYTQLPNHRLVCLKLLQFKLVLLFITADKTREV